MESEKPKKIGRPVPILAPGFGTRVKAAADAFETRKKAAEAAGVSADMIQRYIREESVPGLDKLERLAARSGYRYRWLAYAEEPMRIDPASDKAWLDGLTIGQRHSLVRIGVLNRTEYGLGAVLGQSADHVRAIEADEAEPGADYLEQLADMSGVRLDWLTSGTPPMLEHPAKGAHQLVDARLKRAAVNRKQRSPSEIERALEQMPASAAVREGRVSLELLTQVVGTIEQWLHENRNKVRIGPEKKAMLIALAYTHFEGREFAKQEMEQFFRLVA